MTAVGTASTGESGREAALLAADQLDNLPV